MGKGKRVFGLLGVLTIVFAAASCQEEVPRPPVTGDIGARPGVGVGGGAAGTTDGGALPDSASADSGDAGACTDLPNTGAAIDQIGVADDPPAGTGGTISDGIYDIIDARVHQGLAGVPGLTGASYQGSIRITGGQSFERVLLFKNSGGALAEARVSGTLVPNGVNGTIALVCPVGAQEAITYSVMGNNLTISNLTAKETFTFAKKP